MATDGRLLEAGRQRGRAATRTGLLATIAWIGVASGIVLVNALIDVGLRPTTLGAALALSAAAVFAIVGRSRALHGPDEWVRAGAVVAGVILAGVALVGLVLAAWSYLTFGPPDR